MIEILHHGAVNGVTGSCHELRLCMADIGAMGVCPRRDRPLLGIFCHGIHGRTRKKDKRSVFTSVFFRG